MSDLVRRLRRVVGNLRDGGVATIEDVGLLEGVIEALSARESEQVEALLGVTTETVAREVTLEDCPPGLFIRDEQLGFITEYEEATGHVSAFWHSGNFFHPELPPQSQRQLKVYPVITLSVAERNDALSVLRVIRAQADRSITAMEKGRK